MIYMWDSNDFFSSPAILEVFFFHKHNMDQLISQMNPSFARKFIFFFINMLFDCFNPFPPLHSFYAMLTNYQRAVIIKTAPRTLLMIQRSGENMNYVLLSGNSLK